jgi:hypothetical protein
MRRTVLVGVLLALFAFLLVDHGGHLGLGDTFMVLLGASLGAVVGLVPERSPLLRAAAFVLGFVAAVVGYAIRVGVLPDIPIGHALAAAIVVLIATGIAAGSGNRLPLWAQLVGAAAFIGSYETQFTQNPTQFTSQWLGAGSTVLLAAAFGFLAASIATEATATAGTDDAEPVATSTGATIPSRRTGIDIVTRKPAPKPAPNSEA